MGYNTVPEGGARPVRRKSSSWWGACAEVRKTPGVQLVRVFLVTREGIPHPRDGCLTGLVEPLAPRADTAELRR